MKLKNFILIVLLSIVYRVDAQNTQELRLTQSEYFYSPALSILAFHNAYPVGKQGGIEIIQHDNRIITNGNLMYTLKKEKVNQDDLPVSLDPIPPITNPERTIDKQNNCITIPFDYKKIDLKYSINIEPKGTDFDIVVKFDKDIDKTIIDDIYFQIQLFPGAYKGKTFETRHQIGVFPFDFYSPIVTKDNKKQPKALARSNKLLIAPDDELLKMHLEANNGTIVLYDDRAGSNHSWFVIDIFMDDFSKKEFKISFRPNLKKSWQRKPVIQFSQAGYHPDQKKEAIIELSKETQDIKTASLIKISDKNEVVFKQKPENWGNHFRYKYLTFDFSRVKEKGIYKIQYGNQTTLPFIISKDVYKNGVWQPALETFVPVQMCHMKVKDRIRMWHGLCHTDDGLQAPTPIKFFDGFVQKEATETPYKPDEHIPGMNQGGWHDAGDDDVNTASTGKTVYHLALVMDEFNLLSDQTTVDFEKQEVYLHKPDSLPDAVQQIIHGLNWLLPAYRVSGHSFTGTISHDWDTYLQTGMWSTMTDNFFYNPDFPADSTNGYYSGKADDRYIFTNKDTRREYLVAAIFAASSRVLQNYDKNLADECIKTAEKIWNYEENNESLYIQTVGTPSNLLDERVKAAAELYLTTKNKKYLHAIVTEKDQIVNHMSGTAWSVSRVIDDIDDENFHTAFDKGLSTYADSVNKALNKNPYGVFIDAQVWGFGWDILWRMYKHYYLVKKYPDLFPEEQLFNTLHFMLGRHPASNISYVSSVGQHKPVPAFGMNRSDYSYIPGGLMSGVNLVAPDFPELKDNHPFIWQQSEYIVFGSTPYIFLVLACDDLLNN